MPVVGTTLGPILPQSIFSPSVLPEHGAHMIALVPGDAGAIVGGHKGAVGQLYAARIPAVDTAATAVQCMGADVEKHLGSVPGEPLITADVRMDTKCAPKA